MMKKSFLFLWCVFFFGKLTATTSMAAEPSRTFFVRSEITRGSNLLATHNAADVLNDPYLVAALYYSDIFFLKIQRKRNVLSPQDEILLDLRALITPAIKEKYITALRAYAPQASGKDLVFPLDNYKKIARNCTSCHRDAIDVFTTEGSFVKSISSGIVVLAETGWQPDQRLAVTSPQGGNDVIVFNPSEGRFYRYCHLGSVTVRVRDVIHAGQTIGTVGHSGTHASLPHHGQHLHLEINQYDPLTGTNRALTRQQLFRELEVVRK